MSKSSTATAPKQPAALPTKSAWSRGPPQTQQQSVSPSISRSQSPSNANPPQQTHSRRPSGLSGIPIKDGVGVSVAKSIQAPRPASVINFGSIADVSAPVSSSPAAVPTVSRDASNVKSFGSIAANSNGTSPAVTTAPTATAPSSSNTTAPSTPAPTTASVTSATPAKKKIDVHKLFQGGGSTMPSPPPQATFGEVPSPPPRQNTLPTAQPQPPQGQHYPYNPPHLRGPNGVGAGGPRSPQFSRPMPNGGPRPPGGPNSGPASAGAMGSPRLQQQQAATQPPAGHPPPQMPPMPQMPQMPPQQWTGYYYYPPPQAPYDPHMPPAPYWTPHPPPPVNHAPPHIPVSPRAQQQPLASPVPPPTPPAAITSTPPSARLHPTAPSFVPRQSKITIKSPNGEAVDLQKFRKPDGSLESPTVENSPKAKPDRRSVVRLETEDARKARLEEEERKEKAKREEEAKAKAKQEAEERAKKELEAEKKRKEEEEAEAKRREEEAARKKKAEEEAEAERIRKEEEEREKQRELERKRAEEEAERLRLEEEERKAKEAEEARIREEEAAKEAQRRKEEEEREKERERELEKEREKEREREQEKEREKERARALQQEATSPATSSPASPAIPLPKPQVEAKKRPVPGRLDLTSTAKSDLPKPLPSALASARIIDKLEMVNYPTGVNAPKEELNVNAPDGKFRYDRDFLLQFMSVCKDKPDLLPPLENLGIELSEQGSNSPYPMGRGGSGRRQPSGGMAPPNSANPRIGLGISGSGGVAAFGGKSGQGAFGGMGSFQPPGRMPSSEERFAASNANRSSISAAPGSGALPFPRAPMIRSTSQGGPGGVSGTNRVRSQRGGKRTESNKLGNPPSNFQPGTPSQISQSLDPVAPLVSTANRWTSNRGTSADPDSSMVVERKVKSLLNKLTMEKFDSISNQIITWANESEKEADGRTLILVIKLVFEKATDEAAWSEMYARLCRKMMEQISPNVHDESIKNAEGLPITGGQLFRKYLLNRCQEDFERGWAAHDSAAAAAAGKAADDQAVKDKAASGEEALYSDEYYIAQKAKRQGLGLVKFIGELFKLQMLTERIMHECIKKLLSNVKNPEEEEIESLCKLLSTVGQALDTSKARNHMDIYFDRMQELSSSSNISSRMQFMLLDVIELRARKWVARNATAAPSTIAQIHEAAAKEKAAAEKESYSRQNRESMSRGGSRRGDHRSEFSQGPDGWTNVAPAAAPRPPAKAGDLTHFGKISKPTAMSFGPSSVFAGKKEGKSGRDSPSLSRANSSSNMFSMLSNAESAGDASGPPSNSRPPSRKTSVDLTQSGIPTEGGGRKRLQLLPRSKPLNDDTGKVDEEAAPDSSDEEADAAPPMTEDQVKAKVEEDVKEMLSVRDIGESESYFSSLPPQHHHILVEKIFSKVLDSKEADIKLAAEVFARAVEKALCSQAEFEQGFTPTIEFLDDICVDAPAAYSVAARLLKAAGLPQSSIQNLAAKIAVEGDPITQPADKLMKEFTALA